MLGAVGSFSLLAADFLEAGALGGHGASPEGFDFVEQQPAGKGTVEALMPGFLALNLHPGWTGEQNPTKGSVATILAAWVARKYQRFFIVRCPPGTRDLSS